MAALIIQLISGAAGGNLAGAWLKKLSLGPVGNSVVGVVGGAIGGHLIGMLTSGATTAGGMDYGTIFSSVLGGGVGGGALMAIAGAVKNMMAKKAPDRGLAAAEQLDGLAVWRPSHPMGNPARRALVWRPCPSPGT